MYPTLMGQAPSTAADENWLRMAPMGSRKLSLIKGTLDVSKVVCWAMVIAFHALSLVLVVVPRARYQGSSQKYLSFSL